MEIILREDVDKLGKAGAVVKVNDGFAHNFLIPRNLAVPLTKSNLKNLEQQKQSRMLQQEKIKGECEKLKERLAGLSLTMPVLSGEEDKLFGSINVSDIAKALADEGFAVDKNAILMDEPIKSLGIYEIPLKLHPEVAAKLKVWIVKK
ncbi:MAG: 50S ribosomal protein L9 [Candidatus Omnitrophica bacterium]|nr:50S ribosomal protein L9 [Candidatus Omnitrophota bacterium]